MPATSRSTWKVVFIIAAIVLIVAMVTLGYLIWGVALLIVLLVLGGGAWLYRSQGPPEQ